MMKGLWAHQVQFGDCDPAGIVFYPNYYRWFDAATHAMMAAHGHTFASTQEQFDLVGWPLIDTGATFKRPACAGDRLVISSEVQVAGARTFRVVHQVHCNGELVAEGFELRFFGCADPQLKAQPIPAEMVALFAPAVAADAGATSSAPVVMLDSIGHLSQHGAIARDAVIVCGSHGGISAAHFVLDHPTRPHAVVFNDAGGGKDQAGLAGLALLAQAGIAAACYEHTSARIGDAADALAHGRISAVNDLASALGWRPGQFVRELLIRSEG
jgi:4-hydroxybenzoyl-CoA thioesterase